jgi:hypothetical protein
LFALPGSWEDGLPKATRLHHLLLPSDATEPVFTLLELRARGNERGLVMTELELSPDKTKVAYRLRHYNTLDVWDNRLDSIHVASAGNLADPIELDRSNPGQGLAWSPDGTWLAGGIDNRLALLPPRGGRIEYLTADSGEARLPVWLDGQEIWYALQAGADAPIERITLR